MASTSSQPNAAVTHNRFAALAMEDMELGADESNNTTTPSRTTEVLNNAGRTVIAVQGSDLNPRDTAGWKSTATKQVSQIQLQPQASKDTQNSKSTSQFSESQAKRIVARVTKASRLPVNLPKEERKVIMRPRGGLCLARLEVDVVLSAVITAASVAKTVAMADTICTNPTQNIIVVSTPDEDRANKYANVRSLYIGGKNYETYAYRTAPHGTAKGVIRGIALDATDEDIQNDIMHPANPLALEAHRIGNTTSVVILFQGTKVPRSVKYGPCRVPCGIYKQHYDVCRTCGRIGHRADVCPTPETKICFACGAPNPAPDHDGQCKPCCKLCNGAHATGTEGCTRKYKVPFVVTQRRWAKKINERSSLSQVDFPELSPPSRGKWKQQQQKQGETPGTRRGRSRSRKRDKSRGRSTSRGITSQEKMYCNQGRQQPARQLNWAQAAKTQETVHTNAALDQINRALRQENEQLKRSLAELTARLNSFLDAQNNQALKLREHSPQPRLQETTPQPPPPEEEKDNIEMEAQPSAENNDNAETETGEADRPYGPAPKRRALEVARERRVNMRLDRLEERQDQLETKIGRLDQTVGALEQKVDALDRKIDVIIQALVAAGIIPQQALNLTQP
ncbi:uncharacterized protein LOC144143282 [Haemaphysalis longicornis]